MQISLGSPFVSLCQVFLPTWTLPWGLQRCLPQSLKDWWHQDTAGKTRVGLVQFPPSSPISDVIRVLPALEEKSCSQEISVWVQAWTQPFVCSSPLTESVTCLAWKLWGGKSKKGCNCSGRRFSEWNNFSVYYFGGGLGGYCCHHNICCEACKDMLSGVRYGQLSGWDICSIRVVGLVCRKSGKETGRNPNWLQGRDGGGELENPYPMLIGTEPSCLWCFLNTGSTIAQCKKQSLEVCRVPVGQLQNESNYSNCQNKAGCEGNILFCIFYVYTFQEIWPLFSS